MYYIFIGMLFYTKTCTYVEAGVIAMHKYVNSRYRKSASQRQE